MKTVIIGAGITGLALGSLLREKYPKDQLVLLEKSRGVGGRIATRRTDHGKFDHGAQFYTLKESIATFHRKWQSEGLVTEWFHSAATPKFMCRAGMTAIAKSLVTSLGSDSKVEFGFKALKVNPIVSGGWEVEIESQVPVKGDRLILTAPMPQNVEILERSGISVSSAFREVKYAKAIVLLFEGIKCSDRDGSLDGGHGFIDGINGNVFSIANQFKKGVHSVPSWTVVMSPAFSDRVFERSDEEILALAVFEVKAITPDLAYDEVQVKKWRYSHPVSFAVAKNEPLFGEVSEGLFLAGDSFGGASVAGAVASAVQLAERL